MGLGAVPGSEMRPDFRRHLNVARLLRESAELGPRLGAVPGGSGIVVRGRALGPRALALLSVLEPVSVPEVRRVGVFATLLILGARLPHRATQSGTRRCAIASGDVEPARAVTGRRWRARGDRRRSLDFRVVRSRG